MSEVDYLAHREQLRKVSAAEELLSRAGRKTDEPDKPKAPQSSTGGFFADLGEGIVEIPRAVVTGARDAAQESVDLVFDAGDAMREAFPAIVDLENVLGIENPDPPELPDIEDPDSNSGKAVKGISQFVTGFLGAGKLKFFKNLAPTSGIGRAAKAAGQGAVADFAAFDPHANRLSDLIQEYPMLQNPVTEFLEAKEGDTAAEGRFKNALEGLGLGVVTDGFTLGLRALKSAKQAKAAVAEAVPRLDEDAFDVLKPPQTPNPDVKLSPAQTLAAARDPQTFINFQRIDAQEDIQNVMLSMADAFKGSVDGARRGIQTFKQIKLNAEQQDAWKVLTERRAGDPLNAEQSVAARNLWAASGKKLGEVAKQAVDNPSEANLFAFRKMAAIHKGIQEEVIAARTETARALASWRIPTGGTAENFRDVNLALEAVGGSDLTRDIASRVAALADSGFLKELDQFVEKSAWARSRDAVLEGWINSLLSGPKTHLVNMLSNTSVAFLQTFERGVAARLARSLGDEQSVVVGESLAQLHGMVSGIKDGFRYAGKAFKTGESGYGLGKVELSRERAISSEALKISSESWLGRSVDMLGAGANIPVRALGAADEFFKTIGYRMEVHAQALRKATQEANAGLIPESQLKDRMADLIESPPETIRLTGVDAATYQTFTNSPGNLTKAISKVVNEYPVFRILLPFIRTPSNIMRFTFERTPLAPLMKHVRADILAGGARRDLALARIGMGTATMLASADLAMNGQITGKGPSDASERQALQRTGWQQYSVKVGDRYFAFNRLDPTGMTLGFAADMAEILANDEYGEVAEKSMDEVAIAISMSIANNITSRTYLSSLSDFFEAMADPERRAENFFKRLAGSAIPTGVAEIARIQDPYMRESFNMLEAIRRRTPGLSDELPPRRDLWGRKVSYQSGLGAAYDTVSPIYSRQEKPEPIDEEILRLEASVRMPSRKTSFSGTTINMEKHPHAWSRYLQLAGNELKHPAWQLGAMDFLNEVVSGKHPMSEIYNMYSDGPDGGKAIFIMKTLNDYREMARRDLLKEFPEIRKETDSRGKTPRVTFSAQR